MVNLRVRPVIAETGIVFCHRKAIPLTGTFVKVYLLQPSEIIPAGEHFAVVTVLDKFPEGILGFFLTAGMPISLDEIYADATVGFGE